MKRMMLLLVLFLSSLAFCEVEITNLKVTPISPFGKVILDFKVGNITGEWPLGVVCTEKESGKVYGAQSLTGDTVLRKTQSQYTLEWDMAADGIRLDNKAVTFKVGCQPTYLVIDLSGGTSAASYPVTALDAPPEGGWIDEYKTTKLVLRRIESGSYKMNDSYDVTISQPFYMGVFEVTQKQYQLVTGSNPASYKGEARPVEQVSWNTIRGNSSTHNWPSVTTVDANSFMGKIRTKTGLTFDLPTEAQWEYACRAGTTSKYNNGGDTEADLKTLGRYASNGGSANKHANVGSYLPNAWGLYDMHGNVLEWCLDWRGNLSSGIDPVGASSGSYRMERGGGWNDSMGICTSSYRNFNCPPTDANIYRGFRLACPIELLVTEESELITMSTYIVATETVDGIEWSYEVAKNGEAKIYKEVGESAIPNTTTGAIAIPSSLGGYPVTAIGDNAFKDCSALTSVTIPESVTLIEDNAFYGCTNLTSVTIPEGVTIETPLVVFSDEMWLSLDVTEIGCDYGYRSPSIGRGRTTAMMFDVVGPTEFSFKWKVSSRSSADYLSWHLDGKKQSSISGTGGDWRTVTCSIPEGIHTIKWDYSTAGYSALGDNCGWVAFNGGAFGGCTSLETVTIPWSTTTPLFQLFPRAYTTLEDVILTGSSTTIVDYFFAGYTSLQSIDIPEGVTSIGVSAFEGCTGLTSITIPSSATSIGQNAFPENVSIEVNGVMECTGWPTNLSKSAQASVAISEGTTEIPGSAFSGCTGLTSVIISNGVTSIGGSAFSGCTSLTSIVIPQSVEVINTSAFRGSALEEVIFEGIPPKFPTFSDAGVSYTGFAGAPLKIVKYLNHSSLWKELLQYYKHSAVNASDIAIPTNIPWIYIGRKVKVVSSFNGGEATSSSETCAEGDEITVTATPKEGYVFLGWSSDVSGISGVDSMLTFTMPEQEEVILVANFFPKALLEGWMDARIDAKVDGETLLTAKQASAATEASISQKVADGELLTPAGAATQTEKVINQKVADGELITSDQLQVMAMEAPVIVVEDGVAKVGVSLKRAASLEGEWEQVEAEEAEITDEGAISVSVPAGEKAGFYKFVVPKQQ